MVKSIVAIDPGLKGAIAFLPKYHRMIIYDLPLKTYMGRKEIDGTALHEMIKERLIYFKFTFAVIEDVHAMPHDGVVSASRFGLGTGIIMGVLNAIRIPILRIKPTVWKSALNLSSDKKKSLALARKLFPDYTDYFRLVKHDGRAEAALMAYYVRENF